MTKFLNNITWVVVILVLIATSCSAANETAKEPSSAAVSLPRKTRMMTLPMAIVLSCILIAFLLICFFYFYFCHCVEHQLALAANVRHNGETGSVKIVTARGLDPAVIATFMSFTYSVVKEIIIGQQVLECAVCLNEFSDHETLRLLPECSHVFHRGCIDEWLGLHITCPVCRANLVPKPNQLTHKSKSCFGPNGPTECHVSIEPVELKHDIPLARKMSRSYSVRHSFGGQPIKNIEKYTLRLPKEVQDDVENSVNNQSTSSDIAFLADCSSKTSLKSASANFVRGSNYFDYERFGHERRLCERSPGITGSSNSGDNTMTSSQRFFTSVRSPLNRLFHTSNNMDIGIMKKLNDSVTKSSDGF